MSAQPADREMGVAENSRVHEAFRLDEAARLSVRALSKSHLAVTEIKYDAPNYGTTDQLAHEDAFLVGVQFRPVKFHELWFEGKAYPVLDLRVGHSMFYDLKITDACTIAEPFHSLQFYFSRAFMNELADDLECPRMDEVRAKRATLTSDPSIFEFARAVRPALAVPVEVNELYSSHLMFALGLYIGARYGGLGTAKPITAGLNGWQERIAKEIIEARIDGNVPIQELAMICGLSTSRFAHAFRTSTGISPHRWLTQRRVERAKSMLRNPKERLSDIALACGFADQAHFNRVFRSSTGATPGDWRQARS